MMNRSFAYNERIARFGNEHQQAAFEKAHDAMAALLEATSSASDSAVIQGLWTAFGTEHRTNQQSGVRAFVEMLRIFGGCERERACDGRNEAAYDFAVHVAANEELFFPFI